MTYHESSTDLVTLIQDLSALTSQDDSLKPFGDRAASLISSRLRATHVALTLRVGKTIVSSEAAALQDRGRAGFQFARPIASRGENHGTLQVDLVVPSHRPELLLRALDTITSVIGLYVAKVQLAGENATLAIAARSLHAAVAESKTLVRATGIIAALHGWSLGSAQTWLQSEAERSRRSVIELADLVVLQRQAILDQPYRRSA